jgi:type IV secretion system protein VirB11
VTTPGPVDLPSSSALSLTLSPLRDLLADAKLTELCINRPGEAWLERAGRWEQAPLPFATDAWCQRLARLLANASRQRLDAEHPLLSTALPDGERVQVVLPPATTAGTVALTIRRPSSAVYSLDELEQSGLFSAVQTCHLVTDQVSTPSTDATLRQRLNTGDINGFLRTAVTARKNILVAGQTGSGKTTLTKALILHIPEDERLITIEDARELRLDRHLNHVRLFYSKDGQGQAQVTPRQLLEATLRMRPDRILLAELRGEEAFDYLRNVNSGHPGSITSIHAGSPEQAFEQLVLLVKGSEAGRQLAREDILALARQVIDIVIQLECRHGRRQVTDVWLRP